MQGIGADRGDINREISVINSQIHQLRARLNRIKEWQKTELENTSPSTLS
ncbi:MAG: hypothetical protein LBU32_00410 [Clostridiales bacterium]|nr:hypothetical protein [Clostridiales bacterium]